MARKSRGRQKIEMAKMKNESNLQVTFSKRRFGLFKKASELVTLCGAEVGLIVFSPGKKVFSFGHPNVETIIEKFISGRSYHTLHNNHDRFAEAHRAITALDLTNELTYKENLLDGEKRLGDVVGQRLENSPLYYRWWKTSVDELNKQEVEEIKVALEGLKKDVVGRMNDLMLQTRANTNPTLDSGHFGRNFAPYSGFNRFLPFAAGREGDAITSMLHQTLGASGAGSSTMPYGLDLGYGGRYI